MRCRTMHLHFDHTTFAALNVYNFRLSTALKSEFVHCISVFICIEIIPFYIMVYFNRVVKHFANSNLDLKTRL